MLRAPLRNPLRPLRFTTVPPKTRAILMGDFNTWELPAVESTRTLFVAPGFTTPFSDDDTTFLRRVPLLEIKLKLDWIWLRGFSVDSYSIDRNDRRL
jgi:endonuclease/exonuclease/phosphatase family metal-dependent hydrolase